MARDILRSWRFGVLLLMVLCTLVIEPILFGPRAASWIFDLVYSFILISAVLALSTRRRGKLWFGALGAVTLSATWVYHIVPAQLTHSALIIYHLMGIVFLFLVVATTLKGLFAADKINLDIVLGSLAGYLLLGTAWALVYSLIHLLSPDSFAMGNGLPQYVDSAHARFSVFIYYSFVTLTTLGFGDMSPVSQAARTLSWFEAAVGQFYIATLVAGIVGIFISGGDAQQSKRLQELANSVKSERRNRR